MKETLLKITKKILTNILFPISSSANADRWVKKVQEYFKKTYRDTEYIRLGMDQLVGVCLAVFIRRDLASFVKYVSKILFICTSVLDFYRNVGIDTVKTGMGGTLGNKGCVSMHFLHLLTIF